LELRSAQRQLHDRGLYYASKWCAELLCEIDVDAASSGSTSSLTSAMQSRLASAHNSHSKQSAQNSARRMGRESTGIVPPPSFDEPITNTNSAGMQHQPSRRHTITTKLFATPNAAESTPARPAHSGFAPLPPLTSVSPILATPLDHPSQLHPLTGHTGGTNRMRDSTSPLPPRGPSIPGTPLNTVPTLASLQAAAALGPLHLSSALINAPGDGPADCCDQLLLARSYFDLKEYRRAAFVLRDVPLHPRTLFVRCYSLYLAGEKRKEEEILERGKNGSGGGSGNGDGTAGGAFNHAGKGKNKGDHVSDDADARAEVSNRELRGLQSELARVLVRDATTLAADGSPLPDHPLAPFIGDGHLWFLYGLVLRELGLRSVARNALLVSVATFPWNWGAWQALGGFVQAREQLEQIMAFMHQRAADQLAASALAHQTLEAEAAAHGTPPPAPLPPHAAGVFMKDLFYCECLVTLQSNAESESLAVLDQLCAVFPDSMHVRVQSALAYYSRRMFPEAQHLLELAAQLDPHRLEHMDTLSNILFVHNERAKLSMLAHEAMRTEKYCVQTCCIVGNYYSLRGSHARAVLYFQRALALDPSYLSAWTLLGHEYVELRHTALAIGAYRRALDINPLDYRAWYGLGQTYEILQCSKYALYYFQRAAAIKPYDPRMWCAIGENYEKLATECDQAAAASGPAGTSGLQAARLLESALKCFQKAEGNNDADGVALHKLAKLYRRRGQNELAAEYYSKVLRRHESDTGTDTVSDEMDADVNMVPSAAPLDTSMTNGHANLSPSASASTVPLHPDAIDAMLFLAEYYFKQRKQFAKAEAYCTRLMDGG
jgi:anaphase-promoting complex subunit 8